MSNDKRTGNTCGCAVTAKKPVEPLSKVVSYYEARTKVIKAMAHPTRLYIVDLLSRGSLCVCEINRLIDADMSTLSKHLSLMREAGVVESKRIGKEVHYTLSMPCTSEFLGCIDKVLVENASRQQTAIKDLS